MPPSVRLSAQSEEGPAGRRLAQWATAEERKRCAQYPRPTRAVKHRLVIPYDKDSASPLQIAGALRDEFDLIWVVDSSRPLGTMGRLLGRTGQLIDIAGLAPDMAANLVDESNPEGIVAFVDSQLLTASMLADQLDLRFNRPATTRLFLDKYAQRKALEAGGCAVPSLVVIPTSASTAQVRALAGEAEFPSVLKPRDGTSSRDTYHIDSLTTLLELFGSMTADDGLRPQEYVLEEYIPDRPRQPGRPFADYVSVESVAFDGEVRHLGITGKWPLAAPYREVGSFIPSDLSPEDIALVLEAASQAIAALGADQGCLHTEIKLSPAGARVIESNGRVGGGAIDDLFAAIYGESLIHIAAKVAVGIPPPAVLPPRQGAVAYRFAVQAPQWARRLTRLEGLDKISALPGVVEVAPNREVDDEIDWRTGNHGHLIAVRGSSADHVELGKLSSTLSENLIAEFS
ncbi:MAG: hypothetical protein JWM85_1744 [Acidimicrobiaceae bacterium]|nr:hypothetical protein [Acidimicrobiaceae bacterium]